MYIVLVHEKGHDHGKSLTIEAKDFFCEGNHDPCKEYILAEDGTIYERYSCYSVISPYGYSISTKSWEEIIKYNDDFFIDEREEDYG